MTAHTARTGLQYTEVCLKTASLLYEKKKAVIAASVTFALLLAVVSVATRQQITQMQDRLLQSSGMTFADLQRKVDARLQHFTQEDGLALIERFRHRSSPSVQFASPDDELVFGFMVGAGPWLLLSFFSTVVIQFVAYVFFLLLATGVMQSAYDTAARLPRAVVPMAGLMLWIFFRSLVWIPFVGWLIAFYLLPRLSLAPVLLASGERGIAKSVRESLRLTRGRWVSVFLCLLGAVLLSILALWFGLVIVASIALFSTKLAFVSLLFGSMLLGAAQMFFVAMMTASI